MDAGTTELTSIRTTLGPKCIYTCKESTGELHRTSLLNGDRSCHRLHDYQFKEYCRWSELPGGTLLITGGHEENDAVREVVKIDTLRECAVSSQPPMHSARFQHAVVHHSQYLYVLAGYSDRELSECERYVWAESRWEELPALPVPGYGMSAGVLDNNLYTLGGWANSYLDTVQKLSLDSLTWEVMRLNLPQAASSFPCFKTNTQMYLLINKTLYSFTPQQVLPIKAIHKCICCATSYYSRGTLYYDDGYATKTLALGQLD
jgi:hypothetical protein